MKWVIGRERKRGGIGHLEIAALPPRIRVRALEQQVGQLGDVGGDAPGLVAGEATPLCAGRVVLLFLIDNFDPVRGAIVGNQVRQRREDYRRCASIRFSLCHHLRSGEEFGSPAGYGGVIELLFDNELPPFSKNVIFEVECIVGVRRVMWYLSELGYRPEGAVLLNFPKPRTLRADEAVIILVGDYRLMRFVRPLLTTTLLPNLSARPKVTNFSRRTSGTLLLMNNRNNSTSKSRGWLLMVGGVFRRGLSSCSLNSAMVTRLMRFGLSLEYISSVNGPPCLNWCQD